MKPISIELGHKNENEVFEAASLQVGRSATALALNSHIAFNLSGFPRD